MSEKEERFFYIIFSRTNTRVGGIIRAVSRFEYNHVSVCTDDKLLKMYTFARRYHNSPMESGFVCEEPDRFLTNGRDIKIKLCAIPESEMDYEAACSALCRHKADPGGLLYNTFALFLPFLGRHISAPDTYICVEYAASLLGLRFIYSIRKLEKILRGKEIYTGSYRDYIQSAHGCIPTCEGSVYYNKRTAAQIITGALRQIGRLSKRLAEARFENLSFPFTRRGPAA